jgi:hypothetical protein
MKLHYILGCLAGWALWIVFIAIDHAHSVFRSDLPKAMLPVADLVAGVMGIAAWPVAWGGWFLWAEGTMRPIYSHLVLNIAVNMVLWGTLGAQFAKWWHRRRQT